MLKVLDHLPPGLADCPAEGLEEVLGGPTLLHLPGERPDPLFLSVLLHGNEIAGWEAVRGILRDFSEARLPRSLSVLIGNVKAARLGLRRLDDQPDYNRIWDGGDSPEHQMARQVVEEMRRRSPIASIDVHNTTGPNPHYACVNWLDGRSLYLAQRFSRTAVYFRALLGMQSMAFSELCPSVTIECGLPESPEGIVHAKAYLEQRLFEESIPDHQPSADELELFHTRARVRIPEGLSFSFQSRDFDFYMPEALVERNFQELAEGTAVGEWGEGVHPRLRVEDEQGKDVFDMYFENQGRQLMVRQPFFLSMLTTREKIVEQDCLCYIMERMAVSELNEPEEKT